MEKKDPLLAFLQSHREEFDDQTPPPRVWAQLEQQLPRPRYRRLRPLSALAAAVTIATVSGVGPW